MGEENPLPKITVRKYCVKIDIICDINPIKSQKSV